MFVCVVCVGMWWVWVGGACGVGGHVVGVGGWCMWCGWDGWIIYGVWEQGGTSGCG